MRMTGELDLAAVGLARQALREAGLWTDRHGLSVLVDIDGLEFIDAAGLGLLWETTTSGNGRPHKVQVTKGRGHVADLLRLTGLDHKLSCSATTNGR